MTDVLGRRVTVSTDRNLSARPLLLRQALARLFPGRPWMWEQPERFVTARLTLWLLDRFFPRHRREWVVPFAEEGRIRCSLQDIKDRVILMHGYSEYEVARLVARLVEVDWVCVDVGANSGEYTVLFALCAPRGHVYAFEPAGHVYPRLQANLATNRLPHVTAENVAVGAVNGVCPFFLDHSATNTGLSSLSRQAWHGADHVEETQVSCVTLDHYFAGVDRLDLIKIDVEGHERDVLRGAEGILRRLAPLIIFEFGTAQNLPDSEAPDFLRRLGYDLHCIRYDVARGAQLVPCPTLDEDVLTQCAPRGPLNLVAVPRTSYGRYSPWLFAEPPAS